MSFDYLLSYLEILLKTYLVTLVFGLASFPISNNLFKKYHDYGFNIGKIIGLFFNGYIYFTIVTISSLLNLKIFILNSYFSWIFSLVVYLLLQKTYLKAEFVKNYGFLKNKIKKILIYEFLFLVILGSFFYLNTNFKYFTQGTETLMNVGIFKKIQNSETLPLGDFWLIDRNFNYYYFGHLVFSQIQLLTKVDIDFLYYIICSLIPALLIISSLVFVRRFAKFSHFTLIPILVFIGPIYGVIEYFSFPLNLENINTFKISVLQINTRVLSDAISENFSYTFVYIPAHAHSISLLLGVLMLYYLFYLLEENISFKLLDKKYILLLLIFSLIFMTNTWDYVFYVGLFLSVYLLKNRKEFFHNFKLNFINLELILFGSLLLTLPWKAFFESPDLGLRFVQNSSNILDFLSFWQIYFFIFLTYLFYYQNNLKYFLKNTFTQILIFCFLVLFLLEIFYLMDGTGSRFNTYYKFSNQILLIFSIVSSICLARIIRHSKYFLLKFLIVSLVIFCSFNFFIYLTFNLDFQNLNKMQKISHKFLLRDSYIEALDFINKEYQKNNLIILEYPGTSYQDETLFATLTGSNAVLGWKNHELTWRKNKIYEPMINNLEKEIKEVYLGNSAEEAKKVLNNYRINLIIVGPTERLLSNNKINESKIQKISKLVFENADIKIYEYQKN